MSASDAARKAGLDVARILGIEEGQLWQAEVLIEPIVQAAIDEATKPLHAGSRMPISKIAEMRLALESALAFIEASQSWAESRGDLVAKVIASSEANKIRTLLYGDNL